MGVAGRIIMQLIPVTPRFVVRWIASRYVAGPDLASAVTVMQNLAAEGACFTIDVLGEEISNLHEVRFFMDEYQALLDAIVEHELDANISLKPTAFGLLIDREKALENIEMITRKAAEHEIFVRLDMEDHRVTQPTIDVVHAMHERGLNNIGTVLQGRLFRTLNDIAALSSQAEGFADVRICKGIYLESGDIAHTGYRDIVEATNAAIDSLLDSGCYTAIATHDMPVINHSLAALESRGMGPHADDPREHVGNWAAGKGRGYEIGRAHV